MKGPKTKINKTNRERIKEALNKTSLDFNSHHVFC